MQKLTCPKEISWGQVGLVDYFVLILFLAVFETIFAARPFTLLFAILAFFCGRCFKAACAAARRAIGTRNGEQET